MFNCREVKSELNQKKSKKRIKWKSLIDIKTGILVDMLKTRSMTVSGLLVTISNLDSTAVKMNCFHSYLSSLQFESFAIR